MAAKRVTKYSKNTYLKAHHRVLSPPKEDVGLPEKQLRKKALAITRIAKLEAGSLVFHYVKRNFGTMNLDVYPHYHYTGFGYAENSDKIFLEYGWTIPYKGIRKTNFGTFKYLLSHCGIKDKKHAITWLGKLSYGKLKVEKTTKSNKCSICSKELVPIHYAGTHPVIPPDKPFLGIIDSEGWYEVKTLKNSN